MDAKRLIVMLVLLVAVIGGGWLYALSQDQPLAGEQPTTPAIADSDQAQGEVVPPAQAQADVASTDEADPAAADADVSAEVTDGPPAGDDQALIAAAPVIGPADPPAATADEPDGGAAAQPDATGPINQWYVWGQNEQEVRTIGAVDPDSGFKLMCRLTNVGAAVAVVELAEHFVTVEDKRLYESSRDDPAVYERARQADPERYRGRYTLCRQVTVNGRPVGALATADISVRIVGDDDILPLRVNLSGRTWRIYATTSDESSESVTFLHTIYYGPAATDETAVLHIYKTYTVNTEDYSIDLSVRLVSPASCPYQVRVGFDQVGPTGLAREDARVDNRRGAYGWFIPADQAVDVRLLDRKHLDKMAAGQREILGVGDHSQPVVWVGATNKYFATLMYMDPQMVLGSAEGRDGQDDPEQERLPGTQFYLQAARRNDERVYLTGVNIGAGGGILLSPDDSREVRFSIYAGPKDRGIFVDANNPLFRDLYRRMDYLSTIEFACCCPAQMAFLMDPIQWLSRKVIWLLSVIAGMTGDNYGVAIIVLVLLVRLCLHPLTKKSQVSMMKMQKLQPQIQKLRDKYGDDKETLNKEMMRIYKEQGAKPLLGCLPMLLQMPILIALFTGINASVQLRHAAFLPMWITDLAAPDRLFTWSRSLPLIGQSFNLLPVLLCVAMFFQTKMNPQMSGQQPASSEQAAQQQKMMKYMMPGMMLVFFYKAASGLTLYFMASTAAGVVDQWAVRRHIRQREEAQAATETTINMPGKAARGHRPKKPKDPFKTGM